MTSPDAYESFYRDFDSPLMRQIRREAYGEDVGQHSWVRADELRADVARLQLAQSSRFIDLGCGPCGPLTFILALVRCAGTGVDTSPSALRVGRDRAGSFGVDGLLSSREVDLDGALPYDSGSFDAAISLDVVLHLRDRSRLFGEVARVLSPVVIPTEGRNRDRPDRGPGRFLFTDAGVLTGSMSNDDVRRRSRYGYTTFVSPGWNERLLEAAGFRIIECEDRTASVLENALGRLAAMQRHRFELEGASSISEVAAQCDYLEAVVDLTRRGALSRFMYLAERGSSRTE